MLNLLTMCHTSGVMRHLLRCWWGHRRSQYRV